MEKVRSNQAAIPCTELSKTQLFSASIVKFNGFSSILLANNQKCVLGWTYAPLLRFKVPRISDSKIALSEMKPKESRAFYKVRIFKPCPSVCSQFLLEFP